MKKEKKCLLITGSFALLLFAIFIIIGILNNPYYGLVIGWTIGSIITLITQFLIFKSGEIIGTDKMDTTKGTVLVIVFYATRFLLYAAGLVTCALLDYKMGISVFKYSIWTCLAALLPSHLVIAFFYKDKESKEKANEKK